MPELPEVETVRRGLEEQLAGRTFAGVSYLEWPRTIESPAPEEFHARLAGRRVLGVRRRAKFIVVDLAGGEHLVIHLRMTGRLRIAPRDAPRDRHERVALAFDDGEELRFSDIRRFGRIGLYDDLELARRFRALGPEPLADDLDAAAFAALLARRRTRLKPLLLDQSFLAGLGNIYVDEALHRAGLHPLASADSVPPDRAAALHAAIREILGEAIASGGTSFANFRDAYGGEGDYYARRRVYGRADEPCPTCGAAIVRIVVGGRGTHLCLVCQPLPQGDPDPPGVTRHSARPPAEPLRRVAERAPGYDKPGG